MRIFKTTWFDRFAAKEAISDDELRSVVNELETGQPDANLGGGVFKMRLARPGAGKSGGYRVVVFFRAGERTFFVYGFAKSDRGNISRRQLAEFKNAAKIAFSYTDAQLDERVKLKRYLEIEGVSHETVS
ncbi:MAG: type II toxin-antitoxin system RelE/ParE family toxin [Treponema sp.]|jgi:hypothetical protein|nr:type II toxin-antitoxin system RelE/ParE family toxin [Treponema sp.]